MAPVRLVAAHPNVPGGGDLQNPQGSALIPKFVPGGLFQSGAAWWYGWEGLFFFFIFFRGGLGAESPLMMAADFKPREVATG